MALKAVEPLDKSYHRQRHLIVNGTSLVDCQPRQSKVRLISEKNWRLIISVLTSR